jgi:hypothetical protein
VSKPCIDWLPSRNNIRVALNSVGLPSTRYLDTIRTKKKKVDFFYSVLFETWDPWRLPSSYWCCMDWPDEDPMELFLTDLLRGYQPNDHVANFASHCQHL